MSRLKYADLGNLLRRWRSERFASVQEFCEATKLVIPVAHYERYENGEDLASPEALETIAAALERDVREALVAWAQAQVTSIEHKALFAGLRTQFAAPRARGDEPAAASSRKNLDSNQIPESGYSETWVFGEFEHDQLARYPWLLDFLIGLATAYPSTLSFQSYAFLGDKERDTFIEKYLKRWIKEGRLVSDEAGFRLAKPYIHMPKTPEWQNMRDGLLSRVIESLIPHMSVEKISARQSHRTFLHKVVTEEQFKEWVSRLAALEMEFSLAPSAANAAATGNGGGHKMICLLMLLAPRELGLPEHITMTRKKFPSAA